MVKRQQQESERHRAHGERAPAMTGTRALAMPVVVALGVALLLGAAGGCSPEVHVDVVLKVPADLQPNLFRLVRNQGGGDKETEHKVEPSVVMQQDVRPILFRVGVPGDGTVVMLRAQALQHDSAGTRLVLAAGEELLSSARRHVTVQLYTCPAGTRLEGPEEPRCQMPVPGFDGGGGTDGMSSPVGDAGVGGDGGGGGDLAAEAGAAGADGGGDGGAGERADAWVAPACEDPVGGSPAPMVNRPATVTAGCDRYCAAMEVNCPTFHRSKDRCLWSCEKLEWPAGAPGDGQDTLGCRTAFAESTFPQDRTRQIRACTAAMPRSEGSCGTPCMVYCRMGARICSRYFPPFLDCVRACGNKEAQLAANAQGPQIQEWLLCRMEQLEEAVYDARLCSGAGVSSCGFCGPAPFMP